MSIMKKTGKIGLFIGTERGYEALVELVKAKVNIICVLVLKQDEHEIRNFTSKIVDVCEKNNIPFDLSTKINSILYKDFLLKYQPDVLFLVGWRFLIPQNCLEIPKRGIFVLHDSLLPKYRGIAPTTWPLINGEKETGLSLIYADLEMDAGDIVDQIKINISEEDNGYTMNNKYLKLIPEMILKNLNSILSGTNKRLKQDHAKATYGCKRVPDDGKIDFNKTSKEILRLVKALISPYPGAFCYYKKRKIIICDISTVENPKMYVGRIPGRIIYVSKEGYVDVLSFDGVLRIEKVSLPDNPEKLLKANSIFSSISQSLL